jgi:aminoglycoside 3-N-acetyltransferase
MVHSAMSKLGLVEGGAEAVIGAIRDVVGPDATILMPTYPLRQSMLDWMRDPTPFEVSNTRSEMGKITEIFRTSEGVVRSSHPTHPVAAQGPDATAYVATHHGSGSPAGPGSPFRRLSERSGVILCLGTGIGKVTSHHVIEDLVADFPLPVYLPGTMQKAVLAADGSRLDVSVRIHDPSLAPRRVDNNKACQERILARMRARGIVREGKVGQADAHLFGAADLDAMHKDGIGDGETIYER